MEQLLLALLTLGLLQINLNKESNREWGEMERQSVYALCVCVVYAHMTCM